MTRAEKIEALALDLEAAWSGIQSKPTDRPNKHWLRAATLAQDRIDAAGVVWTRVKDGLPTLPGDYLVTRVWSPAGHVIVSQTLFQPPCAWECYGVLAWAPLPEPWRG